MVIFLNANTPCSYYATTGSWKTNYVTFSGSVCEQILSSLHIDQSGVYYVADPQNLTKHFLIIARIRRTMPLQQHRRLSKALYSLLLGMAVNVQYISGNESVIYNESLQAVIQYFEAHYFKPISLDQLATLVNLRKEYLCTLFKKHMGQTIISFVQTIRIAHARIFLNQFPEKTVQEISSMCGFESASYFCRVFRQVEKNIAAKISPTSLIRPESFGYDSVLSLQNLKTTDFSGVSNQSEKCIKFRMLTTLHEYHYFC